MKKLWVSIQLALTVVGISGLSACSTPVDHKAYACESFGEMRQSWVGDDSDFDQLKADVASVSGVLAVWQTDKGEEDPLYWKLSEFTGTFLAMLIDVTPETAKAYYAEEDAELENIEAQCELPNTYIAPLKIQGGCWNNKTVSAELQILRDGEWRYENDKYNLSEIAYCDDPEYPWGVNFTDRRNFGDSEPISYRIVWSDPEGYEFTSGKLKHEACPVDAYATDTEITIYGSDCDE